MSYREMYLFPHKKELRSSFEQFKKNLATRLKQNYFDEKR